MNRRRIASLLRALAEEIDEPVVKSAPPLLEGPEVTDEDREKAPQTWVPRRQYIGSSG